MPRSNACKPVVVAQRVGRLLGQNSRAAGLFHAEVKTSADGRATLHWKKIEQWRDWAALSEGCYLLRSNVTDWSDEELWKAYIQLTEAEAAFRIHKSDLRLRPIWHQKEERVLAHILVCFLAYVLWKTLGQRCQRAGLGHEPRRVFEELGKIQLVDVVLPTRQGHGDPPPLRHAAHGPPGHPADPPETQPATTPSNGWCVVKTFRNRALRRKDLRQQLANLG